MKSMKPLAWLALGWLAVGAAANAAEPLSPKQFDQVRSVVKPQPEELEWMKIPWLADLWQARQLAAAQGKPILLWEMDGHPLGCT